MQLLKIKREYLKKKITKKNYIQKIYKSHHSSLFDYSDLIVNTDIQKIEIENSQLSFISKRHGIKIYPPSMTIAQHH